MNALYVNALYVPPPAGAPMRGVEGVNTDTDGGDFRGGGAAPGTPCSGAARVEGATMVSGDVWADDEPRYARERTRRAVGEPAVIAGEFRGALGQALRVGVVGRMRRLLSRERP